MKDVLFQFDVCSYLLVAIALFVTARQVGNFTRYSGVMVWAGIAALLSVGGYGYHEFRPRGMQLIGLLIVSWICSSAAALAVAVLLPPLMSLYDGWKRMPRVVPKTWDEKPAEPRFERIVQETPREPTKEELYLAATDEHDRAIAFIKGLRLPDKDEEQHLLDRAERKHLDRIERLMN